MRSTIPEQDAEHPQKDLLRNLCLWGGLSVLLFGFLFLWMGLIVPAAIEFSYSLVIGITIGSLHRYQENVRFWVWFHIHAVFFVITSITLCTGGLLESGGFMVWGLISPLAALVFLSPVATVFVGLIFVILLAFTGLMPPGVFTTDVLAMEYRGMVASGNIVGSCLLAFITLNHFIRLLHEEHRSREDAQAETLRSQRLESLGTLAGGIAHDFNNILMAFLGNITIAKQLAGNEDKVRERLSRAESAISEATALTHQLLTFSSGGAPVRSTTTIDETIRESASFVLHGDNTTCQFEMTEELWPVDADVGQISQLVHNLVLNASQAMPDGGTIVIRAENLNADDKRPGLIPGRRQVHLSVQDEGVGIPESDLLSIFDPYFSMRKGGSGLGLATCYFIVRNHDGRISVDSKQGCGSTFHAYLPASNMSVPIPIPRAEPRPTRCGRILVMDDEAPVREVLEGMLTALGHETVLTSEGGEALVRYQEAMKETVPFDCTILDLTVKGGMGGADTLNRLLELDPGARVLASSGYANDPILAEYARHGFTGVLRKPYSIEALQEAIAEILDSVADGP